MLVSDIKSRPVKSRTIPKKKAFYPITKGLNADETKKLYQWHLNNFLKWVGSRYFSAPTIADKQLLKINPSQLESIIIEYLDDHLQKEKGLKHSTVNTAMCSIFHFCVINDVLLNKTKISKFIPKDNERQKQAIGAEAEAEKDRCYTRQEIETLFDECDKRFKVVILLLASGGLRIGAIPGIELRDLKVIDYLQDYPKIYQLWVYARSKNHKYYTFLTPECTKTIDDYLDFRKEHGEKDVSINETNRSPLIREQFKLHDKRQTANPRKISLGAIEKTIERAINKAGLHTTHKVMMTHGFRKFAITEMLNADVDYNTREYLVGHKHSMGLDRHYDRTSEKKRLVQWSKAINSLTIDSAYHSNKRLEIVEGVMNQKIAEQEQEIARLKAKEHEDSKALGELSKEFNEMKYLLGQLSKESKKQLINEFSEKVGDKADIEWSCD